jgi:hypothetical protein
MNKLITLIAFLFAGSAYPLSLSVPDSTRADYASGMFDAFITQSYGKSTIAFYQFDLAREKAKKAGENPLKLNAIEALFAWYRMYASSLRLYHKYPAGTDRIIGEYRPALSHTSLAITPYKSEWGNSPEQARLMREFMLGVGEVISGVFCISVGSLVFGAIGVTAAFDGTNRIYSSLNSLWALHQTELHALKNWEQTALKSALNN